MLGLLVGILCSLLLTVDGENSEDYVQPNGTSLDEILYCIAPDGALHTGHDSCFRCLDKENVISSEKVCDGTLDCADFSDECLCEIPTVPMEACEVLYDPEVNPAALCSLQSGNVNCGAGQCLTLNEICNDGKICPNGIDKTLCNDRTASITAKTISCNKTFKNGSVVAIEAIMCDGSVECDAWEDECSERCLSLGISTFPSFCVSELGCLSGSWICDGIWDSENSTACGNERIAAEENDCSERRFDCSAGDKISIPNSKVCDGIMDCDDGSDEHPSLNCTDGRFYCYNLEVFSRSNLRNIVTPFIAKSKVLNGHGDCPDTRDECHMHEMAFNSETQMVSSTVLRVFLWINGVKASVSNTAVFFFTLYILTVKRKLLHKISRCHHLLILNLTIADLLMGVYLVIVGSYGVTFSGSYCEKDLEWRSSDTCTALGVISFLSSEMSVAIMLIMAVFRLATIYKPILTYYSNKTERFVRSFIVLGWAISIVISLLPLLGRVKQNFTSHGVIRCSLYQTNMPELNAVRSVSQRFLTYIQRTNQSFLSSTNSTESLDDIQTIHGIICPQKELKWIGFYGQNSICMPRIFANPQDSGWEYSVVFITYNFISFFAMMVCYISIVRISTRPDKLLGEKTGVPVCKLQARVTKLVLTDFLCWIPICIIGFVYAAGVPISSTLYAVCGIILIPINSAINPSLYSGICETCMKKISRAGREKSKSPPSIERSSKQTTFHTNPV